MKLERELLYKKILWQQASKLLIPVKAKLWVKKLMPESEKKH
jgi:hypothetical protein